MRAISPSSRMISQMTPAGYNPARRARSTAASVCPARTRTPPCLARKGTTCPGRVKSEAIEASRARVRIVWARSAALIPVVTPSAASTVTVYAVRRGSRLSATISGSARRSARDSGIGAQM